MQVRAFERYIRLLILEILLKFNLSKTGLNLLTYPVYLKIILLSLLFLLILKIRNPLLFVISTMNLFVVLFLTNKLVTELDIENSIPDS